FVERDTKVAAVRNVAAAPAACPAVSAATTTGIRHARASLLRVPGQANEVAGAIAAVAGEDTAIGSRPRARGAPRETATIGGRRIGANASTHLLIGLTASSVRRCASRGSPATGRR